MAESGSSQTQVIVSFSSLVTEVKTVRKIEDFVVFSFFLFQHFSLSDLRENICDVITEPHIG